MLLAERAVKALERIAEALGALTMIFARAELARAQAARSKAARGK